MAGSRLDNNWADIQSMLDDGASQAQVIRHFKQRGVEIPRSTLSDYVRKRQDGDMVTAAMDDAEIDTRYRAAMEFQRASADELIDKLAEVVEGVQQLKQEGDERQSALLAALGNLRMDAPDSAEIRRMLDAAVIRLDALASRTTGAALRWVWLKALGITGVCWGLTFAAMSLLL